MPYLQLINQVLMSYNFALLLQITNENKRKIWIFHFIFISGSSFAWVTSALVHIIPCSSKYWMWKSSETVKLVHLSGKTNLLENVNKSELYIGAFVILISWDCNLMQTCRFFKLDTFQTKCSLNLTCFIKGMLSVL